MSIFGEPPRAIAHLKNSVNERDDQHEVRITRAYLDYEDRLTQAERKVINSTLDPARRTPLKPHDSGIRRRDPDRVRSVEGL